VTGDRRIVRTDALDRIEEAGLLIRRPPQIPGAPLADHGQ
jgi:hypothetical protein